MTDDEHEIVRAVARLETKMEHVDEALAELHEESRKMRSMLWRIMWVLLFSLLGILLKSTGLAPLLDFIK